MLLLLLGEFDCLMLATLDNKMVKTDRERAREVEGDGTVVIAKFLLPNVYLIKGVLYKKFTVLKQELFICLPNLCYLKKCIIFHIVPIYSIYVF